MGTMAQHVIPPVRNRVDHSDVSRERRSQVVMTSRETDGSKPACVAV